MADVDDFPVPAHCPNCGVTLPLKGLLKPMIYAIVVNIIEFMQEPEPEEPKTPTTQTHQDPPTFGDKPLY